VHCPAIARVCEMNGLWELSETQFLGEGSAERLSRLAAASKNHGSQHRRDEQGPWDGVMTHRHPQAASRRYCLPSHTPIIYQPTL